jgi:HNH endonuclease
MALSEKIRLQVRKRADYHCEYCKYPEEFTAADLETDHIVPESKGGSDDEDNLCAACRNCNSSKLATQTAIDPETHIEVALFNPRTQKWSNHFRFSADYTQIMGLTQTGRATILRLRMNRDSLIVAREHWRGSGWNPPID